MSTTTGLIVEGKRARYHYNSDFSGDMTIVWGEVELTIPAALVKAFSRFEQMANRERVRELAEEFGFTVADGEGKESC